MSDFAAFQPVTQTVVSDPATGVHGNCLSACLASITGIRLELIPNFANFERDWFIRLWEWGEANGLEIYTGVRAKLGQGPCVVAGPGPRGFQHACVWIGGPDGMIAWDPHPSRAGLLELSHWMTVERASD